MQLSKGKYDESGTWSQDRSDLRGKPTGGAIMRYFSTHWRGNNAILFYQWEGAIIRYFSTHWRATLRHLLAARTDYTAVYIAATETIFTFGGRSTSYFNDVWVLQEAMMA